MLVWPCHSPVWAAIELMVKIPCWKHCSHLLCLLSLQYMQGQPMVPAHIPPFLSVIDPQEHLPITSIYGLYNLILTLLQSMKKCYLPLPSTHSPLYAQRDIRLFFFYITWNLYGESHVWSSVLSFHCSWIQSFIPPHPDVGSLHHQRINCSSPVAPLTDAEGSPHRWLPTALKAWKWPCCPPPCWARAVTHTNMASQNTDAINGNCEFRTS